MATKEFMVRLAREDDLVEIVAISNRAAEQTPANFAVEPESLESWQSQWRLTSRTHPWLVAADHDDSLLGFAKASRHRQRGAYHWTAEISVYVEPGHHGRGIGRALYDRLIDMLRRQGYHTLLAGIALPNDASVRLHESVGFRHVGTYRQVGRKFGRWHDVGYWQLMLRDASDPPGEIGAVDQEDGDSPQRHGGH
ncbi:MAG: GNAT family N-acetyltransferase [Planctomycetota bacterium]|jgi:phosphinothricin acetyltransferase